ncbi:MAG TPA: hypothetical protein VHB98_16190 [Chloroflexota bacterium]|nr:hypothetical protein [Chloroflexota bacterium]
MHSEEYHSSFAERPPFARGHRHGPQGPHAHGWGDRPRFSGRPGFGPPRWGWQRPPFAHGPRPFGPPWRHGEWHRDPAREQAHAALRSLRPTIAGLIGLAHAAEPSQVEAIQAVLHDARRRIAAILAESGPAPMSRPAADTGITMF